MAYTDAQIDSLLADKQKQIDLKAAKSEILALSNQQESRILSNENSVSDIQTDISNLNSDNASLNSRILAHHVSNIFATDTGYVDTGQYYLLQPSADVTIGNVKVNYVGTQVGINVLNDATEILTDELTGAQNTWLTKTPDTAAGLANTSSLILDIKTATGVTKMTVQVDFAIG